MIKKLFFCLAFLFLKNLHSQDNYYWVGGSGNWSNYSSHWATSSGGNIFHTSTPSSDDNIFFDSNSFSAANQIVTLNVTDESCKNMNWTGVTNTPKFNMTGKTLEVHSSVTYDPLMEFQSVGTLSFVSSITGSLISSGHNVGNIYVRKPSGTFNLLSPLRSSHLQVENGSTFYTNDYDVHTAYAYFYGGATVSTTIYTGTSSFTIAGGSFSAYYSGADASWNVNKYLEANLESSTIILESASLSGRDTGYSMIRPIRFGHVILKNSGNREIGNGVDYIRKLDILQEGTYHENYYAIISRYFEGVIDTLNIVGKKVKFENRSDRSPTIGNLSVSGDGTSIEFYQGSTVTISNTLSFASSSCSVVNLKTTSSGNQATINLAFSGVVTGTNLSIRDLSFTGSGTLNAISSVDGGNNSGVNISQQSPRNLYWIGGTGNWSDSSHWATSNGGSTTACAPTPNDNIFFTSNSFSAANQVVTLNVDNVGLKNMDWTGVTNTPKFNMTNKTLEISGSVTYTTDMQFQSVGTLSFISSSTASIHTGATDTSDANSNNIGNIYVRKPSGTFNLLSPLRSSHLQVENGSTFYTNDYDVRTAYAYFYGGATVSTTIYTGTSSFTIAGGSFSAYYSGADASWNVNKYLEANLESSTIILESASLSGRDTGYSMIRPIRFGHVILKNSGNREIGNGVDYIRKLDILQEGTYHENYYAIISRYFEGVIDTLNIVGKKVKFENRSDRSPTIGNLSVSGDGTSIEFYQGSTVTISNTLSFASSSCSVVNLKTTSSGNQATINLAFSGVVTGTNLSIRDLSFTGSGTLNAISSVDGGNNSGVNISQQSPRNLYWIGGTGNWSDSSHWATSNGGSTTACAPTPNDNIFFTSNSFSAANQVVTLNVDNVGLKNMDWTGVTNTPKFNMTNKTLEISGSVTYTTDMQFQSVGTLSFISSSTASIHTGATDTSDANSNNIGNIYVRKPSGTFNLLSPLRSSHLQVENGSTFYTNDYDVRTAYAYFYGGATVSTTIYTGTSSFTIAGGSFSAYYSGADASWNVNKYLEANLESSTIILESASLSGRDTGYSMIRPIRFGHVILKNSGNREIGNGVDYIRKLDILQEGTYHENYYAIISRYFEGVIDTLNIVGKKVKFENRSDRSPTIGNLSVSGDGTSIEFYQGSTVTISNTLSFNSKSGSRSYIKSTSSGSQASLIFNGDDFCGDYIRVKDIALTTSATVTLGPYSQNEGNVSGFNFNTDSGNTLSGMTITTSPTGATFYQNQEITFVVSSTYTGQNSSVIHFFVNGIKTQTGTSTIYSSDTIENGDIVFSSIEIPYSGTVTGCSFSTIGKTDDLTMSLSNYPVIISSTYSQTANNVAVTFNEPVFTNNDGSGNLIASDFQLSLLGGSGQLNSSTPSSISKNGNIYTLGINTSNLVGSEVLTIRPNNNQIFDYQGQRADVNQSNNSVRLGTVSASLSQAEVSTDNLVITITFSEQVYNTINGSGNLELSDFILELSGGTATLSSTTPISIFQNGFKYSLGFEFNGIPDGNELINVKLAQNSIFDIQGVALPQVQSNSSDNLNADDDSDGVANPIDLCSGTTAGVSVNMNGCEDSATKFYWVGGTGNWSDFSNHWANSSGGSTFHSRAPNSGENLYFDQNSFSASDQIVTIDIDNAACKNISWSGVTNNPKFDYNYKQLKVYGSFLLNENMIVYRDNTNIIGTASVTFDSKGKQLQSLRINGPSVSLSSPLIVTSSLSCNSGVFTTNNHDVNTGNHFYINVTQNATMTINLGTSSITTTYSYEDRSNSYQSSNYGTLLMNNSQATYLFNGSYFQSYAETPWERIITNRSDSNNITFTDYGDIGSLIQKGNGKIRLQQTSRNNGGPHGNNLSKIGYAEIKNSADFTGNVSFTTLKLQGNGAIYTFGSNYSYSVSETFELGQAGCAITTLKSNSPGTAANISSVQSLTSNYLDIQDINYTGTASFTANNSINNGNNSGITFGASTSRNLYWIGETGNWSDGSQWSLSSGGSAVGCPPTSADNLYFDQNSFSASDQVVTIDIDNAACKNISWSGVTNNPKFDYNYKQLKVYGSFLLNENMIVYRDNTNIIGTASVTFDSKGKQLQSLRINGPSVSLSSPLIVTSSLSCNSGVFTTNNHDVNTGNHFYINVTQNATMTINLGTSSITTTYSYEDRSNSYQSSNYGTLLMNNSQATYLFNGSYFQSYAETPWERIITNRSDSNNITFTDYGDIGSLIQKGNGKIRLQQTSRNNGGPHGNNLSKIGYAEIKNSADFTGTVSFTTLKLQGNGAIYTFGSNYSYSVSETFELGQAGCAITTLKSNSPGTAANISSVQSLTSNYLDIQDINYTGTASFTANNSINNGNNGGITFGLLQERNLYWIGETGNWSDGSQWSLSSGGSAFGCPPTSVDNLYFDQNSFSASDQIVTIDIDNAACKNISWSGVTNNPKFDYNYKQLNVYGSFLLNENMIVYRDNTNIIGTASVTFDSKGKQLQSLRINGPSVSLSSPLIVTSSLSCNSGVFTTNNHDVNTGNHFYINVTQNATMTINLGTSSITTTYSYEDRSNSYQSSNYGTLLMNNSQATYLFNGSYFQSYAETPWERIITNRSDSNNITFTDYGDIGSLIQKGNGKIRLQQTSRNNGGPHRNNLSKIGYAEIKNSADFTGNVSFTTLKLQGNGAIYTFGSNYSYSVSETFELNSPLGQVSTIKSSSSGSQTDITILNSAPCVDYISVKDINFSSTATITAGPNSNDEGNNSGIEFYSDSSITLQGISIISDIGTSIADFQSATFTATSTSEIPSNATLNWYVNKQLIQSGTSKTFSAGVITQNYDIECAIAIPYSGSTGSCSFSVKGKSNTINMNVSTNPIIRETIITSDNKFIKVKFSEAVFTNSNSTGELTTNDFRLYINGGVATLSNSYPTSILKEGAYYKLTFGLNGKLNGQEVITVKPNGDYNIYDSQGLRSYQNQSNNTVTLNYNPPIIDGVSVNSALNELTVVFSEPVNGSDQIPYSSAIRYNAFHISVSGGNSTLATPLANSISGSVDTYKLQFTLQGTPNGNEIFRVTPVYNQIFDLQGFAASHLQSYNTTCVNCDSDSDGINDASDACPNTPSGAVVDQNGCSDNQKDADYDGVPDSQDYCLNTPLGTDVSANGCSLSQNNQQDPSDNNNQDNDSGQSSNTTIDSDSDGIVDQSDNCPTTANANQADADNDGIGDACDNAPNTANSNQTDSDGDGVGDAEDTDDDNDGVPDALDAFPTNASESLDSDGDGIGDQADPDADDDGIADENDNCITIANVSQADMDGDGLGDVCDTDADGDGYTYYNEASCGTSDFDANSIPLDTDGDLIADCVDQDDDNDEFYDVNDRFPLDSLEWADNDTDGIGDNADTDDDNDGWLDTLEDASGTDPKDNNDFPIDTDLDGDPDSTDTDDDNDTYLDTEDSFPLDSNEWSDNDNDGIGDNADLDDDNDDCLDVVDDFPFDPAFCRDIDGDGIEDVFDFDSDNDGIPDSEDAFPLDPNVSEDSDGDGIADSIDEDDNNDGFPDDTSIISTVLTPNQPGLESTWKIINLEDYPFTSVKVYAADGSLVYKSANYQNDWTGTNIRTGSPLPTGPYYYRISLGGASDEVKEGWLYIFN